MVLYLTQVRGGCGWKGVFLFSFGVGGGLVAPVSPCPVVAPLHRTWGHWLSAVGEAPAEGTGNGGKALGRGGGGRWREKREDPPSHAQFFIGVFLQPNEAAAGGVPAANTERVREVSTGPAVALFTNSKERMQL